jgi:hypothetical protein
MLECASADEAADRVRRMDGPAAGSFLIIDAAGRIRNLEILPQALAVIARDGGVFVHANHCLDATVRAHEAAVLPALSLTAAVEARDAPDRTSIRRTACGGGACRGDTLQGGVR